MKTLVLIGAALVAVATMAIPETVDARGGSRCTRSINRDKPHCVARRQAEALQYQQEKERAPHLTCAKPAAFKEQPAEWNAAYVRLPIDLNCPAMVIPAGFDCSSYERDYGGRQILVIHIKRHEETRWDRVRRYFWLTNPTDVDRVGCNPE